MLSAVDLSRAVVDEKTYPKDLRRSQRALNLLANQVYLLQHPVVVVFEGWQTAGTGAVIQCLTEKLDPRSYMVHAITAPTGEAAAHHFLWRFWQRLPNPDQIAIFDRSWYQHVLDQPLSGQLAERGMPSAYMAINDFERQLIDFGVLLHKFWLQTSPSEIKDQDAQHASPDQRDAFDQAAEQMLRETNSVYAPWTIVEADDRRYARLKVLDTLVRDLSEALKFDPFEGMMSQSDQADGKKTPKKKKKKKKKKNQ